MAITYALDDLYTIQRWPNVAVAWHDVLNNVLHVKVVIGKVDRVLTFDLNVAQSSYLRQWVALEVMRTTEELRDIDTVRRRLTA